MKISSWQLLLLLFLSRLFTTITFFSLEDEATASLILPFAVSVLVEIILFVPAILLYKKYPKENAVTSAFKVNKIFGIILICIYSLFLVFMIFKTVRFFLYFFETSFPDLIPVVWVGIMLLAASVYVAYLGIEAAARSAAVVFGLFIVMLLIVIPATASDFEISNYYTVPISSDSLLQGVLDGISRSDEIVILILIMPYLREKLGKAVYGFLGLKLVFIEGIIICCMLLLGGYMIASPFSFFTMCRYAKTAFIERLDAVYLVVWTLMGVIKLSLYSIALRPTFENVISNKKNKLMITALPFIIGGIPALLFAYKDQMIIPFTDIHIAFYAVIALGFLIPLIVYFLRRFKREKNQPYNS